jgi:hypothetical protein
VVDQVLFDEARDHSVAWMRVPIQWRYFEPADGEFQFSAGQELWLQQMEARRINMSPVITIGRCWASGPWAPHEPPAEDTPSLPPSDLEPAFDPDHAYSATYYDYIFTFVDTYAGRIDRITVENEINARNEFWDAEVEPYIRVLATARKAAMDADPDVLVFDSGMGSGAWGAPVAQDRYLVDWDLAQTQSFLLEYYDRDVYFPSNLRTLLESGNLSAFFSNSVVEENYQRVTYMLDHLWSDDLGMLLVDGLNIKFTGPPWLQDEVVAWIDERIAAAVPPEGQDELPLPKVNNEMSNWCVSRADYDPAGRVCILDPADGPKLARELMQKYVMGLDAGILHGLWFPFSNANVLPTPRLGLFDYDGQPTPAATTFALLGRLVGPVRAYIRREPRPGTDVLDYVFREVATGREDLHVLWWDDGGHGAGADAIQIASPDGSTATVWRYTSAGDSVEVPLVGGEVSVTVSQDPMLVYFDDGYTPIQGDDVLEPVGGAAPSAVVLAKLVPNPSPGRVEMAFGVPAGAGPIRLEVFDVAGRRVAEVYSGRPAPGVYRVHWDGRSDSGEPLAGGVYLVRLASGVGRVVKRLVLSG